VVHRVRPFIRQHDTHRQLVGRVLPSISRRFAALDAIIVPASRPAQNLEHAVDLARAMNSWLVVFCSRQARAEEVRVLAEGRQFYRALAIDLPTDYSHKLLQFASTGVTRGELPPACENPNGDLSTKRNLGLLLARLLGWERIFFMDDDIRKVAADDLRATAVMLMGRYRSVGMRVTDFPDNSVVCHAHRQTGSAQDVFVSGSVLAVNSRRPFTFFPEVYNEDWLFFYDDACARRLGWSGRNATQLYYDPFEQPQRAERQEFGDVLAEGLYALLDEGLDIAAATREYWNQFLVARKVFLENIITRSDQVTPDIQAKMVSAVQTAMICLMQTKPAMYEKYVRAWRKDVADWTEIVAGLQRSPSIESALRRLDLKLTGSVDEVSGRGHVEPAPSLPPILTGAGTPGAAP
jgi:hypothetical protein